MNVSKRIIAVIPAYNSPKHIARSIESLLKQSLPPSKIVVIDDHSETMIPIPENLQEKCRIIRNPTNIGFAGTLNSALSLARDFDFMFVLQDDIELLNRDYISRALEYFSDPTVAIVTGVARPSGDLTKMQKCFARLDYVDYAPLRPCRIASSFLKADLMSVQALIDVNGFRYSGNKQLGNEDHNLGRQLADKGYRVILDPSNRYILNFGRTPSLFGLTKKEWLYGKSITYGLSEGAMRIMPRSAWDQLKLKHRETQAAEFTLVVLAVLASLVFEAVLPTFVAVAVILSKYLVSSPFARAEERVSFGLAGFISTLAFGSGLFVGSIHNAKSLIRSGIKARLR
jgi:glycosyltransferase involved in cell wall biosynthesis